jgi:aspartokinase-like uncharacterized kinase
MDFRSDTPPSDAVPARSQENRYAPLVVKIGGSLFDTLGEIAPVLRHAGRPLLIVPGGGRFADAVRELTADEDTAHWMAIAAMEQFGWYIHSFGFPVTEILRIPERPAVLLPYRMAREIDPLPHTWEITSDTISAWIAHILHTDLLVLKSVDGIIDENGLRERVSCPILSKTVDPGFIPFVLHNHVKAILINGRVPGRLEAFLRGIDVPGTRIDATF